MVQGSLCMQCVINGTWIIVYAEYDYWCKDHCMYRVCSIMQGSLYTLRVISDIGIILYTEND